MKTAYPQVSGTCSITLYSNVPFDNTYANHSLISDLFKYNNSGIYTKSGTPTPIAKEQFLDRKNWSATGKPYYYPRYKLTGEFNFNFSNGLLANVTLELTPAQTNANYMKVTCGSDDYYYFITGISQNNFETYTLSLELDVLMTYQDEFLEGIKDMPVVTDRKHCYRYTNDGKMPHCADLRSGEETFAGVKPQYIVDTKLAHFKDSIYKSYFEDVVWLYICLDQVVETFEGTDYNMHFIYKGVDHPLSMACVPIHTKGCDIDISYYVGTYPAGSYTGIYSSTKATLQKVMENLVGSGHVHGCKLSPYPPFSTEDVHIYKDSDGNIDIRIPSTVLTTGSYNWLWESDKANIRIVDRGDNHYWFFIIEEKESQYELEDMVLSVKNTNKPAPTSSRYLDPKLLFSPFRKYCLSASYGSYEIYPELFYAKGVFSSNTIPLKSVSSCFIGDNTFYTYVASIEDENDEKIIYNYELENIGLSSNVNYIIPAGQNALEVFNATQSQAFYQSKTASGITAGLTIAGGVGSIVAGGILAATGYGASIGVGLIGGGATAVASGLASTSNIIKSTNAKIEDLKNTPDSFNVAGSSYTSDVGRANRLLPYLIVYGCSEEIKERANDFFYNYGYQVARECYFNVELKDDFDDTGDVDLNLLGRDIFNFVKLNEDITNKINADIPLIVKQKLSKIFTQGITLWSWFGFAELWSSSAEPSSTYYLDRWFLKCDLDNTEIRFAMGD